MYASLQGIRRSVAAAKRGPLSIFIKEAIRHPGTVGAIWPSSVRLAQAMANLTPRDDAGYVVELGAGTGAVTQQLLAAGVALDRLIVVERSAEFVAILRTRFPGLRVVRGDAAELSMLLPPNAAVATIVSSLPLRSLASDVASAIVEQWQRVLNPQGRIIQFTYAWFSNAERWSKHFSLDASSMVWANVPPARVVALAPRLISPGALG